MATDHALMSRARDTGESVLRVYSWNTPVLSLGRNQRAVGIYADDEINARQIDIVRRPTGGRALLHHREVTYSVTAPAEGSSLGDAYRRINGLLINALRALGVPASEAEPEGRHPAPTGLPCFAEPSAGELVVGGQKLVGSAQWRDQGALLQHGSIIVEDDQSLIPLLMREPSRAPAPAALSALLGRSVAPQELATLLFEAVRSSEDSAASILELNAPLQRDIDQLEAHYRDPSWTWRR